MSKINKLKNIYNQSHEKDCVYIDTESEREKEKRGGVRVSWNGRQYIE